MSAFVVKNSENKYMRKLDAAKFSLVAYALTTSPLAGIGLLGYILYTDNKVKILENQVKAAASEREEKAMQIKDVVVKGNVTNFDIYKSCVIENYQNRFFRIQKPSGEYVPKIFGTQDDAKKEINLVAPYLMKRITLRNKIYNIRYVK
jgi:hypothetical protein